MIKIETMLALHDAIEDYVNTEDVIDILDENGKISLVTPTEQENQYAGVHLTSESELKIANQLLELKSTQQYQIIMTLLTKCIKEAKEDDKKDPSLYS